VIVQSPQQIANQAEMNGQPARHQGDINLLLPARFVGQFFVVCMHREIAIPGHPEGHPSLLLSQNRGLKAGAGDR
jgi:hypothetical protein